MLLEDKSGTSPLRRGLLIDFDYAVKMRGGVADRRMGTGPFMALDVLLEGSEGIQHEPSNLRFRSKSLHSPA